MPCAKHSNSCKACKAVTSQRLAVGIQNHNAYLNLEAERNAAVALLERWVGGFPGLAHVDRDTRDFLKGVKR